MTRAMLLCAGLGTRLGTVGEALPKPLLPMCDLPIVRYGIALLVGHGIRDIVINLHYRPELFEAALGNGSDFGARIQYSREPEILGTGGGLKQALPLLDPDGTDEPFISMNGKLVLDVDLAALLEAHRAAGDVLGTMVVRRVPRAGEWGAIEVESGRVRNVFGEGRHMFCGVHVTRPSVMRELPDGESCSIRQGYLPWIRGGRGEVAAFEHEGYFAEHSTHDRYLQGNLDLLGGAALRHPPGPVTGVDDAAVVHASARVIDPVRIGAGARIEAGATVGPNTVVGKNAVIAAEATVANSVVWAGATASGRVDRAIVTTDGVVGAS